MTFYYLYSVDQMTDRMLQRCVIFMCQNRDSKNLAERDENNHEIEDLFSKIYLLRIDDLID